MRTIKDDIYRRDGHKSKTTVSEVAEFIVGLHRNGWILSPDWHRITTRQLAEIFAAVATSAITYPHCPGQTRIACKIVNDATLTTGYLVQCRTCGYLYAATPHLGIIGTTRDPNDLLSKSASPITDVRTIHRHDDRDQT